MPTAAHSAVAELETLFPTEVDVTAGGRTFSIPRYRLRELQSALRLLEPIAACAGALTASENWASLAMRICIVASREDTVAVLAQALGSEPRELHHLKDHELETLGATLLVVNEEMLRPSKATVPTDTGTFSWAQAVSVLLTAGHRFPDIGDYTPPRCACSCRPPKRRTGACEQAEPSTPSTPRARPQPAAKRPWTSSTTISKH